MSISQLVKFLEREKAKWGDIPVVINGKDIRDHSTFEFEDGRKVGLFDTDAE